MNEQNDHGTNRIIDHKLAHDLRNALSPILLHAQILEVSLAKLSLKDELQSARTITDSVKEMDALIVDHFGKV